MEMLFAYSAAFLPSLSSTILAEEKAQQEERSRMEMRRQVNVSWDSGGSDEAPPKVSTTNLTSSCDLTLNFKTDWEWQCD